MTEVLLPLPPWVVNFLLALALLSVIRLGYTLLTFVYIHFVRPGKDLKRYGKWAIVTGCTDGIGKAMADELAQQGLSIFLISRTEEKLKAQAAELQDKYKIETKYFVLDFSTQDLSVFDKVKAQTQDLDIGVLVNNVGASYDHAEYYHMLTQEKIDQLIRINIYGTTHMTYAILPGMLQRKRGAIVNVSSASGLVSEPLYAVYSASKAFVNTFSKALYYEYKSQGIHIQAQAPAYVTTKLSKLRSTSFFICSPKAYAKSAVNKIGYEPVILPYWTHSLQIDGALSLPIPDVIFSNFLLSKGKDIRSRAYKKKQQ